MELPQPRPFETEGGYLKTQDFLQPLERVGRGGGAKEEETGSIDTSASEKPPPPAPPPSSVDHHLLPGGIGTYTISHVPYSPHMIPKPELSPIFTGNIDANSNCSSRGFTLWDESSGKKGQTRKENVGERASMRADGAAMVGQWPGPEQGSRSSTNNHEGSFSSRSSSRMSGLKSQSFMDMIWSAKGGSQDEDGDDEEEFVMKKESPSNSHKDGKSTGNDKKPSTPRSKHSATEQRRRSKINDRFQMLRHLIPNSEQKRDKASFLQEVIEYIQFLQEKADKFEGSYHGWNPEPGKLVNMRNSQQLLEGSVAFAPKFEGKNSIPVPQTVISNLQGSLVMDQQRHGTMNRAEAPFPLSLQPGGFFPTVLRGNPVSHQFPTRIASEARESSPRSRNEARSREVVPRDAGPGEKRRMRGEEELEVHGGTISISSVYSQGLVRTLRETLESSGLDLSEATISVQIELAKQPSYPSPFKDDEVGRTRARSETDGDDEDHYNSKKCDHKKLKTHR